MWITLTNADLRDRMTDAEITAIESAGEDDDTSNDHVQGAISQITQLVRGRVGSCSKNLPLGPEGTIPDELKWAAVSMIRHTLTSSIPAFDAMQGDMRNEEYIDAKTQLRDAAMCRIAIVAPGGAETAPTTSNFCYNSETKLDFSM